MAKMIKLIEKGKKFSSKKIKAEEDIEQGRGTSIENFIKEMNEKMLQVERGEYF